MIENKKRIRRLGRNFLIQLKRWKNLLLKFRNFTERKKQLIKFRRKMKKLRRKMKKFQRNTIEVLKRIKKLERSL